MAVRIKPLDPKTTTGPSREIFDRVQAKIGMVPNLYRTLGHSPAALSAYLALNEKLQEAKLGPALREKIALAIAQTNGCGYCISAHSMLARKVGVDDNGIAEARSGRSSDKREAGALALAVKLVTERGWISDEQLAEVRAAGLSDAELVEVVALVAAHTFSNYTNHLAHTEIDFPKASKLPGE